jgi:integrase
MYRRKDGLWCAQITLPSGKKKYKYAKTQKDARNWLDAQKNTIRQGVWTDSDSLTVEVFLNHYLNDVVAHNLRPKTQESYFMLTRLHILPELGKIRLVSLRPDHLQSLYALKGKLGYSKRTIQYIHSILHSALDQAVKWGLVPRNVCDAVQAPRPAKKPVEMLTQEQAYKFLEATKDEPLYPLWLTAITTGMRKEELAGLRWVDVNLVLLCQIKN